MVVVVDFAPVFLESGFLLFNRGLALEAGFGEGGAGASSSYSAYSSSPAGLAEAIATNNTKPSRNLRRKFALISCTMATLQLREIGVGTAQLKFAKAGTRRIIS